MAKIFEKVNESGIFDEIKHKISEFIMDYAKKSLIRSQKEIFNYVEKQIELKIKKELKKLVRKYSFIISGIILLGIGLLFLFYSLFEIIFYLLEVPEIFLNLTYGLFLIAVGFILYYSHK